MILQLSDPVSATCGFTIFFFDCVINRSSQCVSIFLERVRDQS